MIAKLQGFISQEQIDIIKEIIVAQYRKYKQLVNSAQFQSVFRQEYSPHKKQNSVYWAIASAFPSNTVIAGDIKIKRLAYGRGHTRPELSNERLTMHILNHTTHFNAAYLNDYYAMNKESDNVSSCYCYIRFKVDHAKLIELRLCVPDDSGKIVAQEVLLAEHEIVKLIA